MKIPCLYSKPSADNFWVVHEYYQPKVLHNEGLLVLGIKEMDLLRFTCAARKFETINANPAPGIKNYLPTNRRQTHAGAIEILQETMLLFSCK